MKPSVVDRIRDNIVYPVTRRHPYLILTPPYVRTSAGVKALHLLCHCLNLRRCNAFVTTDMTRHTFLAPTATESIFKQWHDEGVTPVVIYPDVVRGNPLRAACAVRFLANFPGLLGGDAHQHPGDYYVSYSKGINPWVAPEEEKVLHIPLADTTVFHPPAGKVKRSGTCYYAAKYKHYHKARTFALTNGSLEITRDQPDSQTPAEIAEIFRRSELFYSYENTTLVTEARLCGCPVVLLPNRHFTKIIAGDELGWDGMAWGTDPKEIGRAVRTADRFPATYLETIENYWRQLDRFIEETQAFADTRTQTEEIYYEGGAIGEPIISLFSRILRVQNQKVFCDYFGIGPKEDQKKVEGPTTRMVRKIRKATAPLAAECLTATKKPRILIYGAGGHTKALLVIAAHIAPCVKGFIDKSGKGGTFLGLPCVRPEDVDPARTDVILYSSALFEKQMHETLRHLPVRHLLIYGKQPPAEKKASGAGKKKR